MKRVLQITFDIDHGINGEIPVVEYKVSLDPTVTIAEREAICGRVDNYYDATDLTNIDMDEDGNLLVYFCFEEDEWGTVEEKADRRMTELENYIEELDV